MKKTRLEAFSDGVLAILITIMVLELHPPHGTQIADLRPLLPGLSSYALSFVFIGIYWNNHHHLFHALKRVNGAIMWANHHLLFWLSLTPFVTGWMGENCFAASPVALYGFVLFMSGVAYYILSRAIIASDGEDSVLAAAVGRDTKGIISVVIYAAAIPLAFVHTLISAALYVSVAILWLIPDRRIANQLADE